MDSIFNDDNLTEEQQHLEWTKWNKLNWKNPSDTYDRIHTKPTNWVNYFQSNNLWSSNTFRENKINKELYDELRQWFKVLINGHWRWSFKHVQKFSYVMTMNISNLQDKEWFLANFTKINTDILITWINDVDVNTNMIERNNAFNDLSLDIESELEDFTS